MVLLDKLILHLSKLPRVGRHAATRIAISLLADAARARELAATINAAADKIKKCPVCGVMTENELCEFCADGGRGNGQLMVLRDFGDVLSIEKAGVFRGRFHILGGLLSGANGITPQDLFIETLVARIRDEQIREIIFALPNTLEGKTTQGYVAEKLGGAGVSFSELASGIPMGGDLDYIDDGTLALAFGGRKKIDN